MYAIFQSSLTQLSQLAPAHLRIGGTLADTIVYEVDPPQPHHNCTEGLTCLNVTRWQQIQTFVQQTGFELVFGLNEKYYQGIPGIMSILSWSINNYKGTWDPSNAHDFLTYTKAKYGSVFGFELGNELNIRHEYPASACAADFKTLHGIIASIWTDSSTRPWLIGPDEVPDVEFLEAFLNETGDIMDAVTYHLYIGYGLDPSR